MNYLAHAWVLPPEPASPSLVLGALLPDLARALDRRAPRLERSAADRLEAWGARDLARGVRAHQAADAAFHALADFREGCRELSPATEAVRAAGGRARGFFLTHVLLEMLLDASLLERDPGLLGRVRNALTGEPVREAARALEAAGFEAAAGLPDLAARFRDAGFFEDYASDRGVARRLAQVLGRARQGLDARGESALASVVGDLRAGVAARLPGLTGEPAARVRAALALA